MPGLESKLQSKIIAYAESIGCYVEKTIIGNTNGLSDVKLCYKGRFITIECKAPGKKPTALQEFKMRKVREAGGIALWGDDYDNLRNELAVICRKIIAEQTVLSNLYNK